MGDNQTLWELAAAALHAISPSLIVGYLLGLFPFLAGLAAFAWYMIQIWESETVRHWVRNRRMVYKARKIARLRAKEKVISAELEALEMVRTAKVEAREHVKVAAAEAAQIVVSADTKAVENLPPL